MFFITQRADTKGTGPISIVAFVLILAGTSLPVVINNLFSYIISFILFYSGFCSLQPLLPAAVSRYPNMEIKGVIMSFFNSCQFIGSGAGGLLGGIMLVYHPRYLFIFLTFIMVIGLITILGFKDFKDLKVA
jgi:predicted MFS family arabinose efflux permease